LIAAFQAGEVAELKLDEGRTGMEAVDFFEEALAADDFAFFEGFGEVLEEAGGGAEAEPGFGYGVAEAVNAFQKCFEIKGMGLCGGRVCIGGPGDVVGQAIKV